MFFSLLTLFTPVLPVEQLGLRIATLPRPFVAAALSASGLFNLPLGAVVTVLALMLACVLSKRVTRKVHPEPIYVEPSQLCGRSIDQETNEPAAAAERTVSDLMRSPVSPVRESATLAEIAQRFLTSANNFLPVVDAKNQLVGLVALHDLKAYLGAGEELRAIIAYDLMHPPPACVTPDQRLLDVLPVLLGSEQRNIPVVNTFQENRLVGALAKTEVLGLFSESIAAKSKAQAETQLSGRAREPHSRKTEPL